MLLKQIFTTITNPVPAHAIHFNTNLVMPKPAAHTPANRTPPITLSAAHNCFFTTTSPTTAQCYIAPHKHHLQNNTNTTLKDGHKNPSTRDMLYRFYSKYNGCTVQRC
jgi:hypothetical protein